MAPSVSADPHQSDPVEMGWQSCGDLALIDLVLAMGYGHTAEVIEALFVADNQDHSPRQP